MRASKPQSWIREYEGGLVMRIESAAGGRWRVTGGGADRSPASTPRPAAVQAQADRLAGSDAVGPWRRMCQRCDAPMTLDGRNRPDGGRQFPQDRLWVCSSRSCNHAEPADD